jgi:hypothetical protein
MRVFDVVFGYSPVEFYDGAFGFYGFLEEVAGAVIEICRGDQQAHAEQRDDIFDESQCFQPDSPAIFLKSGSPAPASRQPHYPDLSVIREGAPQVNRLRQPVVMARMVRYAMR